MNMRLERIDALFALYCCAALAAASISARPAGGQETLPAPAPKVSGADPRHVLIADHPHGILILANLPHVEHFLRTVCSGPTPCEQMLQQLGIETNDDSTTRACDGGQCPQSRQTLVFDRLLLHPGQIIDTRHVRASIRRLTSSPCEGETCNEYTADVVKVAGRDCACSATGECKCGEAVCGSECAAAGRVNCRCDNCQCCPCTAQNDETTGRDQQCPYATLTPHHSDSNAAELCPIKLMQHIACLMAEKAGAEAALAAKSESHEQLAELMETMADLLADNAALDAKLEAKAEHVKLAEKLAEVSAENARLKAHVELAAERAELTKAMLTLQLENERLKLRLAEHEQKHAADAARTAGQSPSEHRPR
jgi:hypothetical protein